MAPVAPVWPVAPVAPRPGGAGGARSAGGTCAPVGAGGAGCCPWARWRRWPPCLRPGGAGGPGVTGGAGVSSVAGVAAPLYALGTGGTLRARGTLRRSADRRRHSRDRLVEGRSTHRTLEHSVAEAEDAPVRGEEPVAVAARRRDDANDVVDVDPELRQRAVELGGTEGEHPSVPADHPVPVTARIVGPGAHVRRGGTDRGTGLRCDRCPDELAAAPPPKRSRPVLPTQSWCAAAVCSVRPCVLSAASSSRSCYLSLGDTLEWLPNVRLRPGS